MRSPLPGSLRSLLALSLAAGSCLYAGPVTSLQAREAVRQWLSKTQQKPMGTSLASQVDQVVPHKDADGRVLFYEVRLLPEGFVVVSPDDLLEPIVAFSSTGQLELDAHNPFLALLQRDMGRRASHAVKLQARLSGKEQGPMLEAPARRRWAELQGNGSQPATAISSVSDVRVAPIVSTTWNQDTAGGANTYNYYTPGHYVCGCVSTAMSQLMRYWQAPTAGIGLHSFSIVVDGASSTVSTRGGDGAGGPYNWAQMPLSPNSSTTDAERRMIGSLTYDAAVAVNMDFAAAGSGAFMSTATQALRTTFQYSNAVDGNVGNGNIPSSKLGHMVQADLDAGYPVLFGIQNATEGHAIVCDGYGYNGATLYHHLNMGWGGQNNAWYNLPDINAGWVAFNVIDDCVYNVYPTGAGEIVSGRITDGSGLPVAGVLVSNGTVSDTTNAKGIYALKHVVSGTHTLTATKAGSSYPDAVRIVGQSADGPNVGNIWGVDLVQGGGATPAVLPAPQSLEVKIGSDATFTAGATGMGPLHFQWSKNGTPVGTDAPSYTLTGSQSADDQAQITLKVTGSQGQITSAPATLSVTYLYNGAFEYGESGWSISNSGIVMGDGVYSQVSPHGGAQWLGLGDWSNPATDYAVQSVAIPANATGADLSLWMGIGNMASTPAGATNTFNLKVMNAAGSTVLQTLLTRDNTQAQLSGGKVVWNAYGPFDLKAYKGQTVKIRLESVQPGGSKTGTIFAIDDVKLAITVPHGPTATVAGSPLTLVTGGTASFKANVANSVSDNRVDWSVNASGGTFNPVRTAGDGMASTLFTGSATPGTYTVTAMPVEAQGTAGTTVVNLVAPTSVNVNLSSSATLVPLGTVVTLNGSASVLTNTAVTWSNSGGSFSATSANQATWSASSAGIYTLTATSAGAPTRSASTQVQVVDTSTVALQLTPSAATLLPGASQAFLASGDLGFGVNWALSAGANHGSDTTTATTVSVPALGPLTTTTYTLTATHKVDGTKTTTATVMVKGMDLNSDGTVDPLDLLTVAKEWGKSSSSPANLKGSGTVNETDLLALLARMN